MKLVSTLALASLALMSSAFAGEMTGTVKEVDAMKHMIVLEDGMSVMTNDDVKLEGVMAGDKVKIMTDDNKMGTMVEKMNSGGSALAEPAPHRAGSFALGFAEVRTPNRPKDSRRRDLSQRLPVRSEPL